MRPRERALSVLRGKKADQVPWFGDLDYWATSLITKGERPKDFKASDDYLKWHRELRCGFYLQGYFPFKEIFENCDVKTWNEGNRRFREIKTPRGILRECWRYLDISFSEGHDEYLLKTEDDLPAYNFFIENTRYEPDYEFAKLRTRQVGDFGLVLVYTPRSPFMHLVAIDSGIMNIAYMSTAEPGAFAETISIMRKKFTEAASIAAACPADIVMTPENLSAEMVGPHYFELYMKDVQKQWSDMIKASGKFSCIHMDGTLKGLLREECGQGFSFIEACTPAPVGDLAVGDWRSYMEGNNTVLWGGIPGVYFTEKVTDAEFDRFVKEVLTVMKSEPRYVLGVADQVPPDGLARRVARVADLVDEHGKY